jgi:hypothetical protein
MKTSNLNFLFWSVFCYHFNKQFKLSSQKIDSVLRECDDEVSELEESCDLVRLKVHHLKEIFTGKCSVWHVLNSSVVHFYRKPLFIFYFWLYFYRVISRVANNSFCLEEGFVLQILSKINGAFLKSNYFF